MAKKISGSEIVIECLKEQGVDIVFGYPGGAILNVYDALYKHQEQQVRSVSVWLHPVLVQQTL